MTRHQHLQHDSTIDEQLCDYEEPEYVFLPLVGAHKLEEKATERTSGYGWTHDTSWFCNELLLQSLDLLVG